MYQYKAKIIEIYDADTMTAEIQLGFNIITIKKLRILGVDTPELRTRKKSEKRLGYIARDIVRELILNQDVIIETKEKGKFGRWLATVYLEDGSTLQEFLIKNGLALEYFGEKKDPDKMQDLIDNYNE